MKRATAAGSTSAAPDAGSASSSTIEVLVVEELVCEIDTPRGRIRPVDGVSFALRRGETLGIVGESGSGKSMLVRTIMGLCPKTARLSGRVLLNGVDLLRLSPSDQRRRMGVEMGMVFQNPMTSLNPVVPIGRQITEGMRLHLGIDRDEARERAVDLLTKVGIGEPRKRLNAYPHQLSGGMRQRVAIAAALGCSPQILITDEATTALDVTVQRQILDLLKSIQAERQMAIIAISHDLAVMAGRTDWIAVMYAGQIVERAPTRELLKHCKHRYTQALLQSEPRLESPPHTKLAAIAGSPPRLSELPTGCRFAGRCMSALSQCRESDPPETLGATSEHRYACFNPVTMATSPAVAAELEVDANLTLMRSEDG